MNKVLKQIFFGLIFIGGFFIWQDATAACPAPVNNVYTAINTTYAEVQDCVNDALATEGGIIRIPAGTSIWNYTLSANGAKDLVVEGAGTDSTIIDSYPYPSDCTPWQAGEKISSTGYGTCRYATGAWTGCYAYAKSTGVTGSTEPVWPTGNCSGYNVSDGSVAWYTVYVPSGISLKADGSIYVTLKDIKLRGSNSSGIVKTYGTSPNHIIKNIEIEAVGGRGLFLGSNSDIAPGGGVVSGCRLTNTSNPATGQLITVMGNSAGSTYYWQGNPKFGMENNGTYYYVEGCELNSLYGVADNVPDAYAGAKFVMRYNNFNGSYPGWHGNDSGSSGHSAEIYKNLFQHKVGPVAGRIVGMRGGTAVVWGNETDNTYTNGLALSLYRACQPLGRDSHRCDGGGAYDGNSDAGYRCYQQPGSTGNDGITQWPVIAWDNKVNGNSNVLFEHNANFIGDRCVTNGRLDGKDQSYYVKECRDYLDYDSCEAGGACNGQAVCNLWWDSVNHKAKLNGKTYTPYTCPHPLAGLAGACGLDAVGIAGYNVVDNAPPAAPTGLTIN